MAKARCRWKLTLLSTAVWLAAFLSLCQLVPARPRLSVELAEALHFVDITSDSRSLITACPIIDPDKGRSCYELWSGPVKRWDLTTGRHDVFHLADRDYVRPPGAYPWGPRRLDWFDSYVVGGIDVAPGGQTLAYSYYKPGRGGSTRTLRVLNLDTGREVLCLPGYFLSDSSFSPDGTWFGVAKRATPSFYSFDSPRLAVRIFEASTGKEIILQDFSQAEEVLDFCFSPTTQLIAVTGKSAKKWQTRVWDIATRQMLACIDGLQPAFSPDGMSLAIGQEAESGNRETDSGNATIKLIDVSTGQTRSEMKGHHQPCTGIAFAADGRSLTAYHCSPPAATNVLAIVANDRVAPETTLRRTTTWDTATGRMLHRFDAPSPFRPDNVNDSPTPSVVVWCNGRDATNKVFDAITGAQVASVPSIAHVRVSGNARTLVSHEPIGERPDGVWKWVKDHLLGSFPEPKHPPWCLRLVDLATTRSIASLEGYNDGTSCLVSPDGQTLVARGRGKRLDVWDVPPRQPMGMIAAWSLIPAVVLQVVGRCRNRQGKMRNVTGSVRLFGDNYYSPSATITNRHPNTVKTLRPPFRSSH
jgi:WD40 repeat protein